MAIAADNPILPQNQPPGGFFAQFGGQPTPEFTGGVTGYGAPGVPPPQVQGPNGAPITQAPTIQPGQQLSGPWGGPSTVTGTPTTPGGSTAGSAPPNITNPTDPSQVQAWLQWQATQPNTDPILKTPGGIQYYQNVILSNGGLTDTKYWGNKVTLASAGGAVGAGGSGNIGNAGSGSFAPYFQPYGQNFTGPSLQDLQNMPGWQFALGQGVKALDQSAAAKGTVLNGGQQKDILNYATGLLSQTAQQGYDNALNTYLTNYNVWRNTGTDQWGRLNGLSTAGTGAAGQATA